MKQFFLFPTFLRLLYIWVVLISMLETLPNLPIEIITLILIEWGNVNPFGFDHLIFKQYNYYKMKSLCDTPLSSIHWCKTVPTNIARATE